MNVPTPATLMKQQADRKAREAELASSLASAKETMPPTKGPSKKSESSTVRNSSKSRSSDRTTFSPRDGSNRSTESRPNTKKQYATLKKDTGTNSSRGNGRSTSSEGSERSNPVSGAKNRTGTSQPRTTSPRSTKSTPNPSESSDIRKAQSSTSRTSKKSFSKGSTVSTKNGKPEAKKAFERPEHLTQRPLRNNEALLTLRKELEKPARGQFKRAYRTNARQSGKGQQINKENN